MKLKIVMGSVKRKKKQNPNIATAQNEPKAYPAPSHAATSCAMPNAANNKQPIACMMLSPSHHLG